MHLKRGSVYGDDFISCTGTDTVPDRPNFGYQLLLLLICLKHPDLKQACDCLNNVPPYHWSLADLISRRSGSWGISVLMAVFPGSLIPKVQLALFANKVWKLTVNHFLLECPGFKENLDSLWDKSKTKARHLNPVDEDQIMDFITNLDQHNKMLLHLGGLQLPFDDLTANSIKRFLAAAVGKIYKIRTETLHELGAP